MLYSAKKYEGATALKNNHMNAIISDDDDVREEVYFSSLKTGTYTLNTSMTAKDMMVVMAAESEESTESTESTEQRTDLDSSDGTSSDDTGADDAGEEGQNTDENEQAGAVE